MSALYYDSCGHKLYVYNPTDSSWSLTGADNSITTGSRTATGDYIQDWAHHWFYLNNLKSVWMQGSSADPFLGNNKTFGFYIDSTANADPIWLRWALRNTANNQDSLGADLTFSKNYSLLSNYNGNAYATLYESANPFFPNIQIYAGDGFNQSGVTVGAKTISIDAHDSVTVKLVPGAAAPGDSMVVSRNLRFGLNTLYKVPVPTGGGSADSTIFATKYGVDTAKVNLRTAIAGKQPTGNYITALTGDVTASGPGSAAATIANNAVTNGKFRQSAGNSLVGKATSGTGNVSDITATAPNTYYTYDGTVVKADSIDYAHVKNKPDLQNPGVYFSPAEAFDPSFVVFASMIPRVTSTFTHGQPITYEILANSTQHNSSFYDSVWGDPVSERLKVRFPPVRNVLNSKLNVDETLAQNGVFVGPSVAVDGFLAPVYQVRSTGIRINGDGAGNWTTNALFGTASGFSASVFNTSDGGTSFDFGFNGYDPDQIGIQYIGPNNYHIKRVYSGLGIYTVRFNLLDEFGNPVTSYPTTSDEILITNAGMQSRQIPMATYSNGYNNWMTGFANFWIDGSFECWLVAAPTSSASILVRWQTIYPSATNYKIYRATSLYGSRTLIHTGTDGSFVDTGLSSGTLYWYFMVAVIGGVDTDITYFRTSTKN